MPEIQYRRRPNLGVGGKFILCLAKIPFGREVGDHLGPFRKRYIRGDDDSGLFRSFGGDLEEEFGSQTGYGHIAHFVDSDQIIAFPSSQYAAQLQLLLALNQFFDQGGGAVAKRTGRFCRQAATHRPVSLNVKPSFRKGKFKDFWARIMAAEIYRSFIPPALSP